MKAFTNNRELYDYLVALSSRLASRGLRELSQEVVTASRHSGGMSTEFLGESRLALRNVLTLAGEVLGDQDKTDLQDALEQLDSAFGRR